MPTSDQVQEFFDTFHNGIVGGIRKDGTPHLSPNWYSYEGGKIYVSTKRDRVKYRLFANDPRVTFLVDDPAGMRYVSLAGTVTFREDLENVIKLQRDRYRR
jgi:PPOX class probable F420-dependent enzyme